MNTDKIIFELNNHNQYWSALFLEILTEIASNQCIDMETQKKIEELDKKLALTGDKHLTRAVLEKIDEYEKMFS